MTEKKSELIKMREDMIKKLHEHKVMYKTFSRIREGFPDKSKHKVAKMLDASMDRSLKAIDEDLIILESIEEVMFACGWWKTLSDTLESRFQWASKHLGE